MAGAAGGVGGSLVLLHGDSSRDVRLKSGGEGTTTGKFKADDLFQLLRKKIY